MNNNVESKFIDFLFKMESLKLSNYCKIKINEIMLIRYLIENDEKVKMTDLSKYMRLTKSAISQMVAKLEKKGLVERINSKIDRKIVNIFLTKKGKRMYKKLLNLALEKTSFLLEDLSDEQKELLINTLELIQKRAKLLEEKLDE